MNIHGMFLIEMWADNSRSFTLDEAAEKIAEARRFVTDKMRKAGMDVPEEGKCVERILDYCSEET